MDIRFPLFEGGRILKKESLWDIRDYAYGGWQLQYVDYTDGILSGCNIRVMENTLVVGRGMIKYKDFIYLIQEEYQVEYEANDEWVSLKVRFDPPKRMQDYVRYGMDFFLDTQLELEKGQVELCRFCLRKGSRLRDSYRDFEDMLTEYDTVHLLHATIAGRSKETLHPSVLRHFATELCESQNKEMMDYAFAYEIHNTNGMMQRRAIEQYLLDKGRGGSLAEISEWGNEKLYMEMRNILHDRRYNSGKMYGQKVIYVE